jgi:hypothetical protein
MTDSQEDDGWPSYNVGSRKHLHALGVISLCYAAFARGMDDLYAYAPSVKSVPKELVDLYYFSLNEERRLAAIRAVFAEESDKNLQRIVKNLIEYFNWARDARNTLLHAEQYPALFGGEPDKLYLTKKEGKQSRKSIYVTVGLSQLRDIANKMQRGIEQGATIRIYLRVTGVPADKLPTSLKMFAHQSLPETLRVPKRLEISQTPRNDPIPPHLRRSFDQSPQSQ